MLPTLCKAKIGNQAPKNVRSCRNSGKPARICPREAALALLRDLGKFCSSRTFVWSPLINSCTWVTFPQTHHADTFADMLSLRDKDQRQSHRQSIAVPVLIRNGRLRIDGLSINISEGGIYLFAAAN